MREVRETTKLRTHRRKKYVDVSVGIPAKLIRDNNIDINALYEQLSVVLYDGEQLRIDLYKKKQAKL